MIIRGYGKVNLGLDVLRRLPNGYHEVKMVMQSISLYDELTITKREDTTVTLTSNREELLCDESNLIMKAVRLLQNKTGKQFGVDIHLDKHIPMAAGMAGGSADAAATLVGINSLMELDIPISELKKIAVKIGADVPFCIEGGTQLSEGIGEKLTALPAFQAPFLLIAKPNIDVSTKFVYENLHADTLTEHPNIDFMVECIRAHSFHAVLSHMDNVLQRVTETEYPVIRNLKQSMIEQGACSSMMSGSGPTVFGIFKDEQTLALCKEKMEKRYPDFFLSTASCVSKGTEILSF